MRRLLGVDLGTRRIGLAVAEPGALRARPLATLGRGRSLAADVTALVRVVEANGIGELVVGLPLDMAGGEGRAAVAARAWAVAVAAATGLPVTLRDERLSSHVAEGRVGPAKRGPSGGPPGPARRAANRARIDREAARVILEDELAARELGRPGEQVGASHADRPPELQRAPTPGGAGESGTLEAPPAHGGGSASGAPGTSGPGSAPHEDPA
jgi:putative transcription antitermination factor YqgF